MGWRTVLYDFIRLPWGVLTFAITLTSLFVLWPVLPFIARGLTNADRAMVRGLLSPSDELERRIAELESDRGVVVDTAAADLRRIERDLHDGAQARLVNLAMGLGLAKEKLLEDPDAAAAMVDEAHGEVKLALQELRDLARGIHPAVLTDRGLDAALSVGGLALHGPGEGDGRPAGPAGRGHRGHRLLHRLRAAAERQQAQRGAVGVGRRVAVRTTGCSSRSGTTGAAARGSTAVRACAGSRTGWARSTACSSWTRRRAARRPSRRSCRGATASPGQRAGAADEPRRRARGRENPPFETPTASMVRGPRPSRLEVRRHSRGSGD